MKIKTTLITLAFAFTAIAGYAQDAGAPPPDGGGKGGERQGGGPGHPPGGFHLLPPHAAEKLNLTDDQKKQIAELEADVKSKMETILTPEQLKQLKEMHPPHREGGPGGPGGPGGHGQGGDGKPSGGAPITTGSS